MAEETRVFDNELEEVFEQEKQIPEQEKEDAPKSTARHYVRESGYYSEFQEIDLAADEAMRWEALQQDFKNKRILEGFLYDVIPNEAQGRVDIKTEIRGFTVLIPDHQYFTDRAFKSNFYDAPERDQMRRKLQKGRAALYSRMRFVIVGMEKTENAYGEPEYVVIGSRIEAMRRIREEWSKGTKDHPPLKEGDVVDLSVISVGEHHAMLEGFGMECILKYDQISAFRYIRNVEEELCVGNTVQVMIQRVYFNDDGTYFIKISSAALGRSDIEERNAQLKTGATYTGEVLNHNVLAKKYTVIIKTKPARVTVNEDSVLGGVLLKRGDIVSVTITNGKNRNRNINYGTAKYIRSGAYPVARLS